MELTTVALNSEILRPDDQATLTAGRVEIRGYAYAGGDREVVRVDTSVDDGHSWPQADLGTWAWRFGRSTVVLPAGRQRILARARDSTAALEPEHTPSGWAAPPGLKRRRLSTLGRGREEPLSVGADQQ